MKKSLLALIAVLFSRNILFVHCCNKIRKGKVAVVKNDMLLFGALRKVFVCNATKAGLSNCSTNQNP